jgi:acyl-CoA thioesterase YciA
MTDQLPDIAGGAHLRVVAIPRNANPSGDVFGGLTLSQMDVTGATFAVRLASGAPRPA